MSKHLSIIDLPDQQKKQLLKKAIIGKWVELGLNAQDIKSLIKNPLTKVAFDKWASINKKSEGGTLDFLYNVLFKAAPIASFAIPFLGGALLYKARHPAQDLDKLYEDREEYFENFLDNTSLKTPIDVKKFETNENLRD